MIFGGRLGWAALKEIVTGISGKKKEKSGGLFAEICCEFNKEPLGEPPGKFLKESLEESSKNYYMNPWMEFPKKRNPLNNP